MFILVVLIPIVFQRRNKLPSETEEWNRLNLATGNTNWGLPVPLSQQKESQQIQYGVIEMILMPCGKFAKPNCVIVGIRLRSAGEWTEALLADATTYESIQENLMAMAVELDGRRFVLRPVTERKHKSGTSCS